MESLRSESVAVLRVGFAVRQCAVWTSSRGSKQSPVADERVLPPAARLRSGESHSLF